MKKQKQQTDWDALRRAAAKGKPVPFDADDDLYDPDDEAMVAEAWSEGRVTVTKMGRPPVAIKRPTLNMRIDADVMAHLRASGKGWQTRVNKVLRDAVENGVL
ncbi:BrnA antitoxin family protein [Bordetella sp. N]|uniref:BrnA antitoxin family protein n=1 Tax=Bordetella sp. N TaxID=1746199 RepID=UPI0007097823|nr:BrnA antitoxin family protein [Bordetella sp. N]ALM83642.1 hypothetical protein ASB57_12270 [Bordetella sp. N]